ncbi:MAG TPA: hypothetical protein PKZ83_17655 [bacterium]|nr:hypothetical protein [bacterium]
MNAKPYAREVGRMWREETQLIKISLERMLRRNTLSKLTVVADQIGMSHDEFRSKVSINPRTPLQWSERIAIEHYMSIGDPEVYQQYLREYHMMDDIKFEGDGVWVR